MNVSIFTTVSWASFEITTASPGEHTVPLWPILFRRNLLENNAVDDATSKGMATASTIFSCSALCRGLMFELELTKNACRGAGSVVVSFCPASTELTTPWEKGRMSCYTS